MAFSLRTCIAAFSRSSVEERSSIVVWSCEMLVSVSLKSNRCEISRCGLVDGVADLLEVHLGDDVERELVFRHAREDTVLRSRPPSAGAVRYHVSSREDARVAKGSGL